MNALKALNPLLGFLVNTSDSFWTVQAVCLRIACGSNDIKTPTGKDKWSKRTIDVMLSNEKYIGTVRLLDKGDQEVHYISENNHPSIISKEKFKAVQIEKKKRSYVIKTDAGTQRKSKKYSSKKI